MRNGTTSSRWRSIAVWRVAGLKPDEMGIGPVYAIPKLLARHNLKIEDIDLWELNEAFRRADALLSRSTAHR